MDRIYAPWRKTYVKGLVKKKTGCVFCDIEADKKSDKKTLVICRRDYAYLVLNLYPYANGHLLVLPNRHVSDTSKLNSKERDDFYELIEVGKQLLKDVFQPDGFNIGMNIGKYAGAGIPGHVHMHIVPRWKGDINFFPITVNTKIISLPLNEIFDQLTDAYQKRY